MTRLKRCTKLPLTPGPHGPPGPRVVATLRGAPKSSADLSPEHCDLLEEAAMRNGDVGLLEEVYLARRNWPEARVEVWEALAAGYDVLENEHAGALSRRRRR